MEFIHEMSSGIFRVLDPYVTSEFNKHSLTATTTVVANIASAAVSLPYAKLVQVWGRTQGFVLVIFLLTIGIVMMAACKNVETYCAAQVFYNIGYNSIKFSIVLFVADTTAIRNRAFLIGIVKSPTLATMWAYGPVTQRILGTIGFRWGFGMWAIIYPLAFTPLLFLFYITQRVLQSKRPSSSVSPHRTWAQWVVHWCQEFDVVGIFIIAVGLCLLLLALDIYSYQANGWKSPLIICFIVFGSLLIPGFALYEKHLAKSTFIPWHLFTNRTVVFTNIMVLTLQAAEMMASAYFYSLLIVVFRQSVSNATYISNIYYIGSIVMNLIIGVALRFYGHIKYYALFVAVPCVMLGTGLMIKFRTTDSHIGYIILCQILISFGGGMLYPIEQMTLMAVSAHEHVPALLAVESVFALTGKAIGYAISGAIWTDMFKDKLAEYLPISELPNLGEIYGSLEVQSAYPAGSAAFKAITLAYGDTQRIILIVSTCILVLTGSCVLFWQDVDVKEMKYLRDRAKLEAL